MGSDEIMGTVRFFSYRSARVGEVFLELPRETMHTLERALAQKAGALVRNHIVYELKQEILSGQHEVTYLWFSDDLVYFGRAVIEGNF